MPSNWPKHMLPPDPLVAIPHVRSIAFTAGFFTVLALLLIAGQFVPAVPAI